MENNEIILSMIIPVYNVELYLKECLDSIFMHQKISHKIEVIAVNDGSTDGSGEILNEYKKQYDFILFEQDSSGPGGARNTAIKAARGKYLLFVDSDDYLVPGSLDSLLTYLTFSNADIVEYDYKVLNETDHGFNSRTRSPTISSGSGQDVFCAWMRTGFYHGMIWTRAVSRELIISNQLFFIPQICHQDAEWSPKVFSYAGSVCYLPLIVYVYRIREGSITTQKTARRNLDFLDAIASLYEFSSRTGLSTQYVKVLREKISSRYFSLIYSIKTNGKYDHNLIAALEEHKYMMDNSDVFHRKFLYRFFIALFGVKPFYVVTCGWKEFFKNNER